MHSRTPFRGIALKYEEEFLSALTSFSAASALDPTWTEPQHQTSHMLRYLQDIVSLSQLKGKLKPKKLSAMISSLDPSKQLGPYKGGQYSSPNGGSVNLTHSPFSDLVNGVNSEKVLVFLSILCILSSSGPGPGRVKVR